MGAYGSVTTGVTAAIRSWIKTSGSLAVQVFRRHRATSVAITSWTATTTGTASVLAAATSGDRTFIWVSNESGVEVWIRFDTTIPISSAARTTYLAAGERWPVPEEFIDLPMSLAAAANGGTVYITVGSDT